jgi:Rrf2 family protein
MKLTRASNYALHAVALLASRKSDSVLTSQQIAASKGIPERFLLKVLKPLVSANVLTTVKGPTGGYRLAKPSSEITLLDVIEAVEGPIQSEGAKAGASQATPLDRKLSAILDQTVASLRKRLATVALSDLEGDSDTPPPKPRPRKS